MSFNTHHTGTITLANYEEYFILYMDNELTAEEGEAVEAFLLVHPGLRAELEALLATRPEPESLPLEGKQFLLAASMKQKLPDEALLLYVDNELGESEKPEVEGRIRTDEPYRQMYLQLMKTRPTDKEVMECPGKDQLYRRTESRPAIAYRWAAAAAVLLVLVAGLLLVAPRQRPVLVGRNLPAKPSASPVAGEQQTPSLPTVPQATAGLTEAGPQTAGALTVAPPREQKRKPGREVASSEPIAPLKETPSIGATERDASPPAPVALVAAPVPEALSTTRLPALTVIDSPRVQPMIQEKTAGTEIIAAAGVPKKSGLKKFLRKATDFVEQTTGFNPLNENDELLINVIAVKLGPEPESSKGRKLH
ncbi:hypothetical protein V9K67_11995 [Paraflavisolibacter sp. H34]|uniref:anti-sigma factor family protein n=1 Tax=Huijunlia imazamoxiresistens TaxID=3127457 RepID=UPI003017C179